MEFRGAYKHGMDKWKSHKSAAILASCAAQDATVNFLRSVTYARRANMIVLFLNAQIQSLDRAARALGILEAMPWQKDISWKKRLARSMAKGALWVAVPTIINYLRNRDKEWWVELPPYEKWGYTHMDMGNGVVRRHALPFELGLMFGALPCAALEDERKPGTFNEAFRVCVESIMPFDFSASPDLGEVGHKLARNVSMFAPVIDVIANKDWKGDEIVPRTIKENRLPTDQYTTSTSEIAKLMGRHLGKEGKGISPAQIDHILNGFTGNLFKRVESLIMKMADPSGIAVNKDFSSIPVIGTMFLRPGTSRLTSDFYDRRFELRQIKSSGQATLEDYGELSEKNRIAKFLSDRFSERRDVFDDETKSARDKEIVGRAIMDEVLQLIRDHNKSGGQWRNIGIGSVAYEATSPNADHDSKNEARRLLSGIPRAEIIMAMRDKAIRSGGRASTVDDDLSTSAFGHRINRLNLLMQK